jgi:choline dehydrogenase-like flavoprotein
MSADLSAQIYDAIVVGSGANGGMAAKELGESPRARSRADSQQAI